MTNNAECNTKVHEEVCVQATVTIMPVVTVGEIISTCVGRAQIGSCNGLVSEVCTFVVSQKICVEVPLIFSAIAEAVPSGIVCGEALIGGCEEEEDS